MISRPPITAPITIGDCTVVPGNRWDLVADLRPPPPTVTVVVPHYDDEARLELVLAALEHQDHPPGLMQVVVADDGSPRPPTMPRWSRHPSPLLVRQPDLGFRAGAARNLGAAVGEGEVLVFLDGDTVPAPDFVRRLTSWPARLPDALAVGLRHHVDLGSWEPSRLTSWLLGGGGGVDAPRALDDPAWLADGYRETKSLLDADDRSYRFVLSAVLACGRRLFDELGGFDPRFVGYGGEDWEFAFRAFNAGAVLVHEPLAVAWHDGPDQGARAPDPEAKAVERERLDELVPVGRERGCLDERACYVDTVVTTTSDRLPPSADVLARARFHVELLDGAGPDSPVVAALVEPLARHQCGEIHARINGRVVARATSTRALRRSARWSPTDPRALIAPLFGRIEIGTAAPAARSDSRTARGRARAPVRPMLVTPRSTNANTDGRGR
jgi:GT2 family glycosyltransferase